jgi:hypothetical protein
MKSEKTVTIQPRKNTTAIRHAVLTRDSYTCQICGYNTNKDILLIAHITPISHGGTNEIENFTTLCPNCHREYDANFLQNYYSESIAENSKYHEVFLQSIDNIRLLLSQSIQPENEHLQKTMRNLLFANVITSMETYLSDAFINTVVNSKSFIKRLLETTPEFNQKKYMLVDIFSWMENTKKAAANYLLDVVFHNIWKVSHMYKDVLNINFPEDMDYLSKAVVTRHDLVHRNGKTKEGKGVEVSVSDITDLIEYVTEFILNIDKQLNSLIKAKPIERKKH